MMAGMPWKPRFGIRGSSCPGGTTRLLSIMWRLQYRMPMRTSRGVAISESTVFKVESRSLRKISARKPTANVIVDIVSPMMVRNWYEPPKPRCRGLVMRGIHKHDATKARRPVAWMITEVLLEKGTSACGDVVVIVP